MKKTTVLFGCLVIAMVCSSLMPAEASAKPRLLPKGAIVSANCNLSEETATITVTGMSGAKIDYYQHEKPQLLESPATINLNEGRRFNVKDSEGFWALLTPEMASYPPKFFGPGVGLDCSNAGGCAFIITCK